MFEDTRHNILKVKNNNNLYIKRILKSNHHKILKKEYQVQLNLAPLGICPKVVNLRPTFYFEELIDYQGLDLIEGNIQKIARSLRLLHTFDTRLLPKNLQISIENQFIDKSTGHLDYLHLYKAIINELQSASIKQELVTKEILAFLKHYKNRNLGSPLQYCLIHGDLNKNNILLDKAGNIKFIDWSDCRIDEPTADVAQLFYHFSFTTSQKELFFKTYGDDFADRNTLQIRLLLLLVYDVVYCWKMYKKKEAGKLSQIKDIIHNK